VSQVDLLMKAENLLTELLSIQIQSKITILVKGQMNIILRDGVRMFIRYNNYQEYSYTVMFSNSQDDRCRFDNFDKNWDVATKPHHFHPRQAKEGYSSPMKGNPEHDMSLLVQYLQSNSLYDPETRFCDDNE